MKLKKITSGLALLMLLAGTATVASCKGDDEPTPTPDTGDTDNNNDSTGGNTGGTTGGETGGNTGGTTGGETGGNTGGTTEEDPYKDYIKIEDAEDFVDFLQGELEEVSEGSGLVGYYTLAADIDLADVDLSTELTSVYSFQGVFDGAGHKISNLTLACQKNKGLFEGMYASAFKNVVFENVTLSSAVNDKGVSLLGNYIAGNSVLENITIKGFNMTCVSAENGGLVTNAADTVYLKNIAITGINATLANHSGVVLGSMRRGADDIKVVGTSTEHEGAIINAENILLEGSITSVATNNEGIGGLIGRCDAVEEGMELNVDGFASQLVIKSGKNSGALLGNEKNTLEVSLKNCYFLGGKNLLAGTLQSTANMFFGQIKTPNLTYEDCYYVARNAVVAKTSSDYSSYTNFGYFNDENIVPIKASEIEAFKGFTVADGKVSLNGQSITLPTDVTVADVAAPSVTFDSNNVQGVDATTVKITGEIPYFHAASEAGAAGNYVPITFTAATGVDGTDSYYVSGTSVTYVNDETFTVYVPVNELEAGVEAREALSLTIRWNNAAADQTYTVQFDDANITLADAPAYGAVSQDNADLTAANPTTGEGTDAVTDNYTLHYTAGTIAWNATASGNTVQVQVAQPTWITTATTETIKVTNATVVSLESGVLTLTVKVKNTGSAFKVQWSDTTDPNEYKLTFAEAVVFEANPEAGSVPTETISYDGSASENPSFVLNQATAGSSRFASLTEGAAKVDADGVSLQKLVNGTDSIETVAFKASKKAKVAMLAGSTGTSNTFIYKIEALNADGQVVATVHSAPSTGSKLLGYMLDADSNKYVEISSTTEFVKIRISATNDKTTVGDGGNSGKNWCVGTVEVTYELQPTIYEYDGSAAENPNFVLNQATAGSSRFASLTEGAAKVDADGVSLQKLVNGTDSIETVAFAAAKKAKVEMLAGSTGTSNTFIYKIEALNADGQVVATVHSAPSTGSKLLGYMLDADSNKYVEISSTTEFVKIRISATNDKTTVGDGGNSGKNWCVGTVKVTAI